MKEKNRKKKMSHTSKVEPNFGLQMNLGAQLENKINLYRNKTLKKFHGNKLNLKKQENNECNDDSFNSSSISSNENDAISIENNLRYYEEFIKEMSDHDKVSTPTKDKKKKVFCPTRKENEVKSAKSSKFASGKKQHYQKKISDNSNQPKIETNHIIVSNSNNESVNIPNNQLEIKNEESFTIQEFHHDNDNNSNTNLKGIESLSKVKVYSLKKPRHQSLMLKDNSDFLNLVRGKNKRLNSVLVTNKKDIGSLKRNLSVKKSKENILSSNNNLQAPMTRNNSLGISNSSFLTKTPNPVTKKKKMFLCCIPIN